MTRPLSITLGLLLASGGAAFAATSYVPITETIVDGVAWQTEIALTNLTGETQRMKTLFIPAQADGTDRDGVEVVELTVRAGQSRLFGDLGQSVGLLEISGDPNVAVSARMVANIGTGNDVGATVPVFYSDSLTAPDEIVDLQGMARIVERLSDLGIVNLGHEPSLCTATLFRATGTKLGTTQAFSLAALTLLHFDDAIGLLGEDQIGLARAEVSCDQPFSAYARVRDELKGDLVFITNAASNSSLLYPGEVPPTPPPPPCPTGAVCYERTGVFHVPTNAEPSHIENIDVPASTRFSRITVDVDVTITAFYGPDPAGLHNLFWIHRGRFGGFCCWPSWKGNVFGYANLRGPSTNLLLNTINVDLPGGVTSKATAGLALQTGRTYHVSYEYTSSTNTLQLLDSSGALVKQVSQGSTGPIRSDGSGAFMIYFGNEFGGNNGPEVPGLGWQYANARVVIYP